MTSVHEQTQMSAMEDKGLFGAVPFVKWAGGKRALIQIITEQAPSEYGNYWEPFVGGGAVFFSMRGRKVLNAAGVRVKGGSMFCPTSIMSSSLHTKLLGPTTRNSSHSLLGINRSTTKMKTTTIK